MSRHAKLSELVGLTMIEVKIDRRGPDEMTFVTDDLRKFRLYHDQDCCESVWITDVTGNVEDLVGVPLLLADEATNVHEGASESGTWTFYRFGTRKGYVDVRWLGESNGYYSESVSFECET